MVYCLWSLGSVAGFMVVGTIGLLLPAISDELQLSPVQQGVLGSAASWGNIALALPLAWWASRLRPKPLTAVTLTVGTLLLFLQGWAPLFAVLLLGRLAFGISMLVREPARALLIQQWFPPRETILANSVSSAMFGIIVAAGLVVTPLVLSAWGDDWRLVFHLFGAMFGVLTAAWMVFGRDRPPRGDRQAGSPLQQGTLRSALHHRDLWVGGSGFVGATLAWSAYLSFYPTMMQDAYGLSLRWSGLILALSVIVGGMSGIALGYGIMAGVRRKAVLQVTGVLMAGSYLGMTLTGSLPLLLPLALLNGVAWGFFPILFTVPFNLPGIRPREVVAAVAATTTMTAIGMGIGPLLTGVLQGVIGDLRGVLIIVGFATLSVTVAGTLLSPSSESHAGTSKRAPFLRPPGPSRP